MFYPRLQTVKCAQHIRAIPTKSAARFCRNQLDLRHAAPAHHQIPAAAELLKRAESGEFTLHIPNLCLGEARRAILAKCQPRNEANALRRFLAWAQPSGYVTATDAASARLILDKYKAAIKRDLSELERTFRALACAPCVDIFGMDDAMLNRATELIIAGLDLKPFDQAVLASVLVHASRLWAQGERVISFCEIDSDLQPWDAYGNHKVPLRNAFNEARVWVYGDFTLTQPTRPDAFD
jgi:hypothetical protein